MYVTHTFFSIQLATNFYSGRHEKAARDIYCYEGASNRAMARLVNKSFSSKVPPTRRQGKENKKMK